MTEPASSNRRSTASRIAACTVVLFVVVACILSCVTFWRQLDARTLRQAELERIVAEAVKGIELNPKGLRFITDGGDVDTSTWSPKVPDVVVQTIGLTAARHGERPPYVYQDTLQGVDPTNEDAPQGLAIHASNDLDVRTCVVMQRSGRSTVAKALRSDKCTYDETDLLEMYERQDLDEVIRDATEEPD